MPVLFLENTLKFTPLGYMVAPSGKLRPAGVSIFFSCVPIPVSFIF
jgi:hypothetical protein